jgi:hypothetical protein
MVEAERVYRRKLTHDGTQRIYEEMAIEQEGKRSMREMPEKEI